VDPYAALDAFITEYRLCRPGLDEPHVTNTLVALWCECGATIVVACSSPESGRRGVLAVEARVPILSRNRVPILCIELHLALIARVMLR
jgi:hypothetical protein